MTNMFTVLDLLDLDLKEHNELNLRCLCGRSGLANPIKEQDLNRPGLTLSGFFDGFQYNRIQVFGKGEAAYLKKLVAEGTLDSIKKFFEFKIPCCAFTTNLQPEKEFLDFAEEAGVPVLITDLNSSEFSRRLIRALNSIFADKKVVHATLVEVFGIGILLKGASGIGKSETALELIERGHRLIADDAVELSCVNGNLIIGRGVNDIAGHHMEIRGLGIINISHLFGVGAIRDSKQVQLVVELEEWDSNKVYDRLGSNETTIDYLGVGVPVVTMPIKPGRNIPIIIETAAMNERLKKLGYYSAREFNQNVLKWLEGQNARAAYYDKNNLK
ncbi:MAG: HPr(Ser) kinase/phosphatase [Spirochaetales bacterium]|uniref:HPr kinase/phosphorylase n=1 Tax=Candidatus Thalassospirochaeta sargassi TaxID=3119039 RepID=A0AAJ1MLV2_9SPIO|nr:HPr(Ser) kinase/phosphatase [Spirochaetales bacterium]